MKYDKNIKKFHRLGKIKKLTYTEVCRLRKINCLNAEIQKETAKRLRKIDKIFIPTLKNKLPIPGLPPMPI